VIEKPYRIIERIGEEQVDVLAVFVVCTGL